MGAGASTGTADLGGLTDTAVPASQATTASKDFAAKLKATLSTQDGWRDLQELFRSLRSSLDEAGGVSAPPPPSDLPSRPVAFKLGDGDSATVSFRYY